MPRPQRTAELMWPRLFKRLDGIAATRQGQVRDMLVQAMMDGFLQPGAALPASRVLAQALGLSRTTVSLAYEALADQGLLQARARSGFYVAPSPPTTVAPLAREPAAREAPTSTQAAWHKTLQIQPSAQSNIAKPSDWQQQPYPFVFGQFDATLFPYRNWRRCVLENIEARSVRRWAPDHIDRDDSALVEQIHSRLLPARGIWVERDQILVTSGAQQALFLLAQLLTGPNTQVGLEEPGYPDARNNFALRGARLRALDVDEQGLVPNDKLPGCDWVFVTPSHQCPSTVTLSLQRRHSLLAMAAAHDFMLIEDDHESELNFTTRPTPALKSLDTQERVVYLGSLSKTLAHGLRLGFVVGPMALIAELRALRRLMMRHVPANNQQVAALFIAHGFHEAHVRHMIQAYRERAATLRQALARHAPQLHIAPSAGGSALWVSGPEGLDTQALAREAYRSGVVVEPGAIFHTRDPGPCASMRVGYSSIPNAAIEAGVVALAKHLQTQLKAAKRSAANPGQKSTSTG